MTSMLLIISFLLHLVALVAIYQLFKQLQLLKKDSSQDIMELLETYLEEIKEENRLLEKEISTPTPEPTSVSPAKADKKRETEVKNEEIPQTANVVDDAETSLHARILQLHDKGLTVDAIAQKLSCGTTEAELTIKLNKKT